MATVFEYIDESGQDTLGYLFVVSVVIADERRDALLELIERIEIDSKKRNRKWHGSDPKYRAEYLESISYKKQHSHDYDAIDDYDDSINF